MGFCRLERVRASRPALQSGGCSLWRYILSQNDFSRRQEGFERKFHGVIVPDKSIVLRLVQRFREAGSGAAAGAAGVDVHQRGREATLDDMHQRMAR